MEAARWFSLASACSLLAVVAAAGVASAALPQRVAVGPDGLADPGTPYYLAVTASPPERPHESSKKDDCAAGQRAPDTVRGLHRLVTPITDNPPDPSNVHSFAPYFPKCVSFPITSTFHYCLPSPDGAVPVCTATMHASAPSGYFAYNVETGRYYVEDSNGSSTTGTTGVGMAADCEICPPPGLA